MGRQKSATSHTTVAEAPQKEAKLAWKLESEKLLDNCKTMKKKKKMSILNVTPTKRQPFLNRDIERLVKIREMTIDRKIRAYKLSTN